MKHVLLTVGCQLPFDRLVCAMDSWAQKSGESVFGQIGNGRYHPKAFDYRTHVEADELREEMRRSDCIVAHAGMGTLITAQMLGKPLVIVPRRAEFGEHRSDHQISTARRFADRSGIFVVEDEKKLSDQINRVLENESGSHTIQKHFADDGLLDEIRRLIRTKK